MKHAVLPVLAATAALWGVPAVAGMDHKMDHSGHQMTQASATAATELSEGVVKKIDKAAGKVTLAHGPLANLNMPGMTMAFKVKDATWLDQMKVGDKIRFLAEQVGGAYTVVRYEPAK